MYRSEKKFEKAIDNYKKVLELNPQFVESMNNIGSINLILGNFKEGIKYFKEAIKIDKFNSESYYNYISAKKILENDEIFIKLKNLVEDEKLPEVQNFKMYYSLSKSYFDIGNKDLAFKYLELASNFKLREIENSYKKQSKDFKQIKEYFKTSKKISELSNNFKQPQFSY